MQATIHSELVQGFRLGPWLVEPRLNRISADLRELRLESKVMDVLLALASRRGEPVTKEELLEQVWSDVVVVEGVVKRCISELRDALEDDAHQPRFIETIPRRGYRLLAAVEPLNGARLASGEPRLEPLNMVASDARPASARTKMALLAMVVALAIAVTLGTWRELTRDAATESLLAPPTGAHSVAVLPFEYLGTDAANAWLAAGLGEEIIHSLANVRDLQVAARTSSFAFRGGTSTAPEIGRDLGVGTVVEGSIRVDGDDLRVIAQLIDARTGLHVWSRVFERKLADLFLVQDEIAHSVTESLLGALASTGEANYVSRQPPSHSFDAYALYLNALSLWRERGAEAQLRAADLLRAAIGIDPNFARAHSVLGNVYYTMGFYAGMPYEEMVALAEQAAHEALRLDPDDGDALSLLATLARGRFDWTNAARFATAAVEAEPDSSIAQQRYAELLLAQGYLRRGGAQIERAKRFDPLAASVRSVAALAAIFDGDQERALAGASATRALGSPRAGQLESWVYVERGEFERAGAARLESAVSMRRWSQHIGPVYAALADPARVPEALAGIATAPESVARTEGFFFYEYGILGNVGAGLAALERIEGIEGIEGSTDTLMSLWLPELAPLRRAPGFVTAMQKLGLVDYWKTNGMPDLCEQRSGQIVCR